MWNSFPCLCSTLPRRLFTTELSRIPDSFFIARDTAFTYKGKSIDAKQIGKELGVRYVLEGSVQRDQNHGRVNAQLIDTESGRRHSRQSRRRTRPLERRLPLARR
jgi:TolB-like protein